VRLFRPAELMMRGVVAVARGIAVIEPDRRVKRTRGNSTD
jgi:hypothetical protein